MLEQRAGMHHLHDLEISSTLSVSWPPSTHPPCAVDPPETRPNSSAHCSTRVSTSAAASPYTFHRTDSVGSAPRTAPDTETPTHCALGPYPTPSTHCSATATA